MVYVYVIVSLMALSGLSTMYHFYMAYEDPIEVYEMSEMFDGKIYAKFYRDGIECAALKWETRIRPETAELVTEEEMSRVLNNCKRYPLHKHPYKPFKMYPGTKWCGRGNRASNYTDVGTDRELDICCRDHDHCPLVIHSRVRKFGVQNSRFYTSSHCSCDEKLFECLKQAASTSADTVGGLYFNLLNVQCFTEYTKHGEDGKDEYLVKFKNTKHY